MAIYKQTEGRNHLLSPVFWTSAPKTEISLVGMRERVSVMELQSVKKFKSMEKSRERVMEKGLRSSSFSSVLELQNRSVRKSMEKSRSFRDEDYSNRRAFLRSYPLQWEAEERREVVVVPKALKNRFTAALQWGEEKLLWLRRLRIRVALRFVVTHPPPGLKA